MFVGVRLGLCYYKKVGKLEVVRCLNQLFY